MFWHVRCPHGCAWEAIAWTRRRAQIKLDQHRVICHKRHVLALPAPQPVKS